MTPNYYTIIFLCTLGNNKINLIINLASGSETFNIIIIKKLISNILLGIIIIVVVLNLQRKIVLIHFT